MNPVTRTMSEKQALVDFVTMTSALLGVSLSSGRARCSNQYHPPPRTATATTAIAGLRYSESIIAGSVQTSVVWDLRPSLRAERSNPEDRYRRYWIASLLRSSQ